MILERILAGSDWHEEGERYRTFRGERGRIEVSHYVNHSELRDGVRLVMPYYDCTLTITPGNGGHWWVKWWHGGNGMPQTLPWAYESAEAACEAMLTISDAILCE